MCGEGWLQQLPFRVVEGPEANLFMGAEYVVACEVPDKSGTAREVSAQIIPNGTFSLVW